MSTLVVSEIDLLEITLQEAVLGCEMEDCTSEAQNLIRWRACTCSGTFCVPHTESFRAWLTRVSGKVHVSCHSCGVKYRLFADLVQILPI